MLSARGFTVGILNLSIPGRIQLASSPAGLGEVVQPPDPLPLRDLRAPRFAGLPNRLLARLHPSLDHAGCWRRVWPPTTSDCSSAGSRVRDIRAKNIRQRIQRACDQRRQCRQFAGVHRSDGGGVGTEDPCHGELVSGVVQVPYPVWPAWPFVVGQPGKSQAVQPSPLPCHRERLSRSSRNRTSESPTDRSVV